MKRWPEEGLHVALVVWMMVFSGARPAALRSLRWRHIEVSKKNGDGSFPLRKLKGGKLERISFLGTSSIANILARAADEFHRLYGRKPRKNDFVFVPGKSPTKKQPREWTADAFSHSVKHFVNRAVKHSGLDSSFVAYTSRHSILTWLAKEGVADELRARFVGHTSTAMQAAYVHLSGEDARESREAVDSLLKDEYLAAIQPASHLPENGIANVQNNRSQVSLISIFTDSP
jgi:integrase